MRGGEREPWAGRSGKGSRKGSGGMEDPAGAWKGSSAAERGKVRSLRMRGSGARKGGLGRGVVSWKSHQNSKGVTLSRNCGEGVPPKPPPGVAPGPGLPEQERQEERRRHSLGLALSVPAPRPTGRGKSCKSLIFQWFTILAVSNVGYIQFEVSCPASPA